MSHKTLLFTSGLIFLLSLMIFTLPQARAQGKRLFIPDKALCAKMLRFGKEAYARGKYLDAKEYFRKAIQADPTSEVAWRYYDQAVLFALAEKVEKNAGLLLPDVSTRGHTTTPAPPPAPPASKPRKPAEEEEEEEGC